MEVRDSGFTSTVFIKSLLSTRSTTHQRAVYIMAATTPAAPSMAPMLTMFMPAAFKSATSEETEAEVVAETALTNLQRASVAP